MMSANITRYHLKIVHQVALSAKKYLKNNMLTNSFLREKFSASHEN